MKQLRKQAAHRARRIIYNDDGCYARPFETPEKFLKARLQQVTNTQVDSVFYCTGITTMFLHLAQVGEIFTGFAPDSLTNNAAAFALNAFAPNMLNGIRSLKEAGHDILALAVDFCHQNDIEILWSLRMNDIHDSESNERLHPWELSRWKREHPEYMFGEPTDWNAHARSDPRCYWSALDYEIPEVRDYIFRILEDVCQRYDVDGIELDWLRHPKFFQPTQYLQPAASKHLAMLCSFLRRVRAMTERVAEGRGRPLLVACRVPLSVECSLALGLDVDTWLKEELVDILVIGGGYAPMAMAPQVREMTELAHRYEVPAYACINDAGMDMEHPPTEAWRGAAMNIWHAGADGVYVFNFFPPEPDERLSQIGDPETIRGLDKVYAVDYLAEEQWYGFQRAGMVAPGRLPVGLPADTWVQVRLPVGEDIVANCPDGKTTSARLRLRMSNLTQGDELTVNLNGEGLGAATPAEPLSAQPATAYARLRMWVSSLAEGDELTVHPDDYDGYNVEALGAATPAEPLSAQPATAWVELEPDPNLVGAGDNLVEIRLATEQTREELTVLDRLDLVVRYE